jgi:transposase
MEDTSSRFDYEFYAGDPTKLDFYFADGWASIYIDRFIGVDFNVLNLLLVVTGLLVARRAYKVLKKYMLKKSLTKQWGRLKDHFE